MAIFKCKMCGGALEITDGLTVAECEYCGTKQTLPKTNDDVITNLFNRANNLRLKCEFDKAEQIYEKIVEQNDSEAEAHWGIVLCKYGIEYVEDPKTMTRIPTCHRTLFESVMTDADYIAAIDYSDALQQSIYESEARAIDRIQRDILNIVKNEEPFDVFICYKETDANGKRTVDSAIANDIYHQLTTEGFKVFYAAITLEDKLGKEYEPYIFAALNSAKVMLVLGTKPEYFTAVWVKNEWSRFLSLMKTNRDKLLIPCYRDMDAYDLPEEFSHLQAQDMSKIGFINDVIRGIKKLMHTDEPKNVVKETVVTTAESTNVAPLLKRAFMFLEDGEWASADEYCEKVLDVDPENAQAYLGKLMVELKVSSKEDLKDYDDPFDDSNNFEKAIRFGDEKLAAELNGYIDYINERNENARLEGIYSKAVNAMKKAKTEFDFDYARKQFDTIPNYKDSGKLAEECIQKAAVEKKNAMYSYAMNDMAKHTVADYNSALKKLTSLNGWKDAEKQITICQKAIEEIKAKEEAERLENERKAEIERKESERIAKRNKKLTAVIFAIAGVIIAFIIVLVTVIIPNGKYKDAIAFMDAGKYTEAISAFEALGDYKDSADKIDECNIAITDSKYNDAVALMEYGNNVEAAIIFGELGEYKDANAKSQKLWNNIAIHETVSAGGTHTVGLKANGKVVVAGSNYDVDKWKDIVAISASGWHNVGLKSDGTAVAVGENYYGSCNVEEWEKIVAVSAGSFHTVGLRSDGTVVAVGDNEYGQCNVEEWEKIIAVSAGGEHTVGLRSDGTVVAVGDNKDSQCNVSDWTDIVAVSAGDDHTVGLKSDGTVVAVGRNWDGEREVGGWTNIVAIAAGSFHTVGLRSDGTVVAIGWNEYGQCNADEWKDIVAISAGGYHTVGLKADGTVVAVGLNEYGQCNVDDWKDIIVPNK